MKNNRDFKYIKSIKSFYIKALENLYIFLEFLTSGKKIKIEYTNNNYTNEEEKSER